jgi:hypothetical protein
MRILLLLAMALTSISFSIEKERSDQPVDTAVQTNTTWEEEVVDATVSIPVTIVEQITTTSSTTTTTVKPTTTTTTSTLPLPEGKCSEWYPVAIKAGWPVDDLPKLGRIMWAESRCIYNISNCCSDGLVQMEWSAHKGWLKTEFGITEREELYDPYTNLLVARWLYYYAEENYGCGWQPWYMSGDWC